MVAGAGGGMGLNIAGDLLQAGARVAMADIKPPPETLTVAPGDSRYYQGDLTDDAFVCECVAQTVSGFGRLDCLVNATGVLWFGRDRSLLDIDLDLWDRVLEINLKSFVLTSRYCIPEMKKTGGGALVHFSSIDALGGDDRPQDAYGASKAAVRRLSKSIAFQFARDGIRSNVILPGPVLSSMQERWQGKPDVQAQVAENIPLRRLGTTQDQANACLFLLSDKASWITGAELIVDGGIRSGAY